MPFATVSMVPSFGFMTALYAVSVPLTMALARVVVSISVTDFISFVNPLKSCERITPELPLAPLKEPEEMAFASWSMVGFSNSATSLAAAMIVSVIFVPVSPSGTGNTFSSLIQSFLASRPFAPARKAFFNFPASIVLIPTSYFLLINHSHTFHKDVDFLNLHAGEFFYSIFHAFD